MTDQTAAATGAETARVKCASCAELILLDAKVCRFCGRPTAEQKRSRRWPWIVASCIAALVLFVMIKAPMDYEAGVKKLHDANALYTSGLTDADVDAKVQEVADQANVSIPAARDLVVVMLQNHVPPDGWVTVAKMQRLQDEGATPSH